MRQGKLRLIRWLLALYPSPWRQEYGEEFSDLLATRPLRPSTVLDVSRGAFVQHWRTGEPWFVLGSFGLGCNLFYGILTFCLGTPTDLEGWGGTAFAIVLLLTLGFLTAARSRKPGNTPGLAAMKATGLATWPCLLTSLLMLAHLVPFTTVGPDEPVHPFAFIYRQSGAPHDGVPAWFLPWGLLVGFFLDLLFAGLIGAVGGWMGRLTLTKLQRARVN